MTAADFDTQFNRLTGHFHLPADASRETVALDWFKAVEHYHRDALEHAVTELIRGAQDRFWPPLGKLLNTIQSRISRYDKFQGKCETCGGSGWIDAPPFTSNGLIYSNTVARCHACGIPEPQVERSARREGLSEVQAYEYAKGRYGREQMPQGLEAKHPEKPGNPELRQMIAGFRAKFANSHDELA